MRKVAAGAASEDEDALSDGVGQLAFLERAVLHGRQQVLEPVVALGIELIPEHHRRLPGQHGIAHLVVGADQVLGPLEL